MPAASPASPAATGSRAREDAALDPDVRHRLDAAIDDLERGAIVWSHLTLAQRATLLERLHATIADVAEEWADVAATSKGLPVDHPLRGEEWLGGPYKSVVAVDALAASVRALAAGRSPAEGVRFAEAPGGRVRAAVFPRTATDRLLLSGFNGEVWFEPGVTAEQARAAAGLGQRHPATPGGVGLVLGAGNITAIPVADVLYELFAFNRVSVLKVNPTQDDVVPIFERALAPLIEPGFLRIVRGGGDVGGYLATHPRIAHVHITGSGATLDRIVWGPPGAARTRRRRENRPALRTPITAELGGVSPIIVVPGRWSDDDLRYQAEHVVTMRLQNSGHNCIAGQVVVVSADWDRRDDFLRELERAYAAAPARPVWYPGSDQRLRDVASAYPDAVWCGDGTRALIEVDGDTDPTALETTEYFAPVLGVVSLAGSGQEFLDAAVAYCNDRLTGTLGANVLIDPATETALGDGFEAAIARLRYGAIAINAWTAFIFLTPTLTWGGYPGATLAEPQSGLGVVHNALLFDRVERSVARGPFRPFPRSTASVLDALRAGAGADAVRRFSVLPKPPWFVTSRTNTAVSEGFTRFRLTPQWSRLPRVFARAFRA